MSLAETLPVTLPRTVALWKIHGQEGGESGGGDSTVYVLTDGESAIPDPHDAIEAASSGRYSFYCVETVHLIVAADLDPVTDDFKDTCYPCVDQSGAGLSPAFASLLAALIVDLARGQGGCRFFARDLMGNSLPGRRGDGGLPLHHWGVEIVWDAHHDRRILQFIDEMGGKYRRRLVRAGEHENSLELYWRGSVPRGYHVGDTVEVDGDSWSVVRSESIMPDDGGAP
jgi:hypothetical protein